MKWNLIIAAMQVLKHHQAIDKVEQILKMDFHKIITLTQTILTKKEEKNHFWK